MGLPEPPKGVCMVRLTGEEAIGEEGPGDALEGTGGVGLELEGEGVLFFVSLDFVLERFWVISLGCKDDMRGR